MIYQLGEEHFERFKTWANNLLDELQMGDWDVNFVFEESGDNLATCQTNWRARYATLTLNKVWAQEPTEKTIKDTAYHEVLELLLDDIDYVYSVESLSEDDKLDAVARARHAVIHRLMGVLE